MPVTLQLTLLFHTGIRLKCLDYYVRRVAHKELRPQLKSPEVCNPCSSLGFMQASRQKC